MKDEAARMPERGIYFFLIVCVFVCLFFFFGGGGGVSKFPFICPRWFWLWGHNTPPKGMSDTHTNQRETGPI